MLADHTLHNSVCVCYRVMQDHQVEMEREESRELRDLLEILGHQEHLAKL